MTYISSAELKTYLGVTLTTDDTLIATLIASAQKAIETYTHRVFEVAADSVRYFTVGVDTDGVTLYLDRDLCAITTIQTNADAASPTTLATTDYFTVPRNDTPYYAIKMTAGSAYDWTYTTDPESGIKITGRWGYSVTPPADIKMACLRLAGYFFRLKDSQVFDVTSIPEQGIIMLPKGIPQDVKVMLDPYVRRVE